MRRNSNNHFFSQRAQLFKKSPAHTAMNSNHDPAYSNTALNILFLVEAQHPLGDMTPGGLDDVRNRAERQLVALRKESDCRARAARATRTTYKSAMRGWMSVV